MSSARGRGRGARAAARGSPFPHDPLDINVDELLQRQAEEDLYLTDVPVIPDPVDEIPQPSQWLVGQPGDDCAAAAAAAAAASQAGEDEPPAEDTFRILIATDVHLGYLEHDPVRGDDSFRAFEETLQLAKSLRVDFLLLGGDLFHHSKPSQAVMIRAMELLRRYCLGDDLVHVEVLSDQKVNFPTGGAVNYEDPNFNVSLPVFSIHGNHDDPTGQEGLACIDMLNVANLLNHFGRSPSAEQVDVYPVLLKKGASLLALYGLGHIRDQRLHRVFKQGNVAFQRPCVDTDDWFNLFVIHQNRVAHSAKNCIHDLLLPSWMDLVFWGHEHECLIAPVKSPVADFSITQPGSTVATSLIAGEARPKHVGLVEVYQKSFRLTPVRLASVRPFYFDAIALSDFRSKLEPTDVEQIARFLADKVDELLAAGRSDDSQAAELLPLVRLCVNYTGGFQTIHPSRFGQRFVGRVANPDSILRFTRQSVKAARDRTLGDLQRDHDLLEDFALHAAPTSAENQDEQAIGNLIRRFLTAGMRPLQSLPHEELTAALTDFVDKGDNGAFAACLQHSIKSTCDFLFGLEPEKTLTDGDIQALVAERMKNLSLNAGDDSESDHSCCESPPQSPIRYDDYDDDAAAAYNDSSSSSRTAFTAKPAVDSLPVLRQTKSAPALPSAKRAKPTLSFVKPSPDSDEQSQPQPIIKRQRKQQAAAAPSPFASFDSLEQPPSQDEFSPSSMSGTATQTNLARRNAWGSRRT